MRDVRMAGFKYYAGTHEIEKYKQDTAVGACAPDGVTLPKLSNLIFENGYDDPSLSHNPLVIRNSTQGFNTVGSATVGQGEVCCDSIQIVFEDFNQNNLLQPYRKFRITYYAKPNEERSYAAYKRVESYIKPREGCTFAAVPQEGQSFLQAARGVWSATQSADCPECTPEVLIRNNIEDMEFIPFDENGVIIKNDSNQYPAPEIAGIRDRMLDIRGVDIRITFRSKNPFFTRERKAPREVIGFTPNRSSLNEDQYLRDSVIVTVHTRNIGGEDF
tara:strand:- start:758 stop:1579 length:822 start_codon:yes stop_codon:yes gene_type:complete